ncbi:MAG: ribosome silencing factor [Clostridia bacterium]|nr:ribosome silencing factor [Clostridia bacterium]
MTANAKNIAALVVRSLDKHKARDIRVIDVEDVTSICDCFVIAHGNSSTQVRALSDYVEKELKEQHGIDPLRTEGYQSSSWVLVDYGEVIVHVFNEETRGFYDLERLWKDGTDVDIAEFIDNEETT